MESKPVLATRLEQDILLRCGPLCVGSPSNECAPDLLRQVTDWPYLFRLASSHGISSLLFQLLREVDWQVPERYAHQLHAEAHDRAKESLVLTAELLKLLSLFELHSIPAVPFKGPVLSSSLYGDIASREFCDLDILVRQQDVLRAKEVMVAQGYRTDLPAARSQEAAYLRARYELHFTPENGAYLIEIHQAFLAPFFCLPFDYDALWRRLERQTFFGREILSLAPDDLLLVLCIHGAKHSWSRLGWLYDLARLLVIKQDALHFPQILHHARTLGASRILLLGLYLVHHLLSAPLNPEIIHSAGRDASIPLLAQRVVNSLFREDSRAGDLQAHTFFLQARERFRDKLAYCSRLAFTPNENDHSAFHLPTVFSPLYYPLHAIRVFGKYGAASLRSIR